MVSDPRERLAVVLVRARNPSNIGAVARAMHDLGFFHLRIVNEFPVPFQAAKSAVDASSVLHGASEFTCVADAVADCTVVYGTTAVGDRVLEHPLDALEDAAPTIGAALGAGGRVALLFGSEKTGLSNEELSHCDRLLTIPMNTRAERHLSMNLGQAVAVCLYAIAFAGAGRVSPTHRDETAMNGAPELMNGVPELAAGAELERLTGLLRDVLEVSGYTRRHPANSRETVLRRLVHRMMASDAAVWMGILRQLQHALAGRAGVRGVNKIAANTSEEESLSVNRR